MLPRTGRGNTMRRQGAALARYHARLVRTPPDSRENPTTPSASLVEPLEDQTPAWMFGATDVSPRRRPSRLLTAARRLCRRSWTQRGGAEAPPRRSPAPPSGLDDESPTQPKRCCCRLDRTDQPHGARPDDVTITDRRRRRARPWSNTSTCHTPDTRSADEPHPSRPCSRLPLPNDSRRRQLLPR
jgi:hypothetical protein